MLSKYRGSFYRDEKEKERETEREREREVSELIRNAKCRLKSRSRRDRRISLAVRQRKRC